MLAGFTRLAEAADLALVEGAGSPAEINLRAGDIANMGFAEAAGVPVVLIGDIERGGVIAQLVRSPELLSTCERALLAGYIVNKFRGDITLFNGSIAALGERTGPALLWDRAVFSGCGAAAGRGLSGVDPSRFPLSLAKKRGGSASGSRCSAYRQFRESRPAARRARGRAGHDPTQSAITARRGIGDPAWIEGDDR